MGSFIIRLGALLGCAGACWAGWASQAPAPIAVRVLALLFGAACLLAARLRWRLFFASLGLAPGGGPTRRELLLAVVVGAWCLCTALVAPWHI